MKVLFKLFQKAIVICVVFIACHSQLFAQSEPITSYLGVSKKSFIATCHQEKWKFSINEKGSMNFDFPGGNWYVSFDENAIIDLINLTSFGKERGERMMQELTADASMVDDNATVTKWRRGSVYLMYFKMFQPDNGTTILISNDFFNLTSSL